MENRLNKFEEYYKMNSMSDFSFLDKFEIPYSEMTSLLIMFDYFVYDKKETINYFVNEYRQIQSDNIANLKSDLLKFLDFYTVFSENSSFSDFINIGAKIYLINFTNRYLENNNLPKLPTNEIENSIYLDLVTGFDFINFYTQLQENTDYLLVDKSLFTCTCLQLRAEELKLNNVKVLNKDILDLESSDFKKEIGIIRAKNVFRYVPFFLVKLNLLKELLPVNGLFVFQERSMDNIMFNKKTNYYRIKELFTDGWVVNEIEGDKANPLDLDSLIFKKCSAANTLYK